MATTEERLTALETELATRQEELDTFYLLWAGALVFFMQAGFAVLAAGSIRAKNVKNILLKNLMDACLGALIWFFIGFGFAYDYNACYGDAGCEAVTDDSHYGNAFIGGGQMNFALADLEKNTDTHSNGLRWTDWWFQYAFAAAAATIVSGAVAERCKLTAYLVYTSVITGFIYPVVVHWVWDGHGFMSAGSTTVLGTGVIDFAGSGVVHMTGGFASLVAAKVLGPRIGRWEHPELFTGHSAALQVLGTFILWLGWYGFNPGSTLAIHGGARDAARSAVTTTLAAASAAVTGLYVKAKLPGFLGGAGYFDLGHTCNSLLGGLVGITAGCNTVSPWAAIIIGIVAAFVYHGASCMMRKLKIDDPLDAFAVHGACGFWGVLAVGFFANCDYSYVPIEGNDLFPVERATGEKGTDCGVFVGGAGYLLGTQLACVCIEVSWVVSMSTILFLSLNKLGMLRVPAEEEDAGADVSKHGGSAYTYTDAPSNGNGFGAKSTIQSSTA